MSYLLNGFWLYKSNQAEKEYGEAKRLSTLLGYFEPINEDIIPNNSIIREFIGGSIFEY